MTAKQSGSKGWLQKKKRKERKLTKETQQTFKTSCSSNEGLEFIILHLQNKLMSRVMLLNWITSIKHVPVVHSLIAKCYFAAFGLNSRAPQSDPQVRRSQVPASFIFY